MSHQRNLIGQNTYGEFVNVQTDLGGRLKTDSNKTAFGEGLVGQLSPVLQETFHYSVNPRIWESFEIDGVVSTSSSMATMTTDAVVDARVGISSNKRIKYRAGMGVLCRFTALWITDNDEPYLSYIGVGDENKKNGFYFSMTETGMGILHANDTIPTVIPQEDWDDPCDGSGDMPFIGWELGNVFQIQFQYLGFGAIKFFIENPDTGDFQLIHTIKYANRYGMPSLANTTLPFSAIVKNTGFGEGVQVLKTASVALFVEGTTKIRGIKNAYSVSATATTTEEAVITIRNNPIFNGVDNGSIIYPTYLSVSNTDTKTAIVKLIENTTLGGVPDFKDVKADISLASIDKEGTTVSEGDVIITMLVAPTSTERINLFDYDVQILPNEELTVSSYTGNSTATLLYTIGWKEDI